MKTIVFQLLLVVAFAALAECTQGIAAVNDVNEFDFHMQEHLAVFSQDTHPQSPQTRLVAQGYIRRQFNEIGLEFEEQTFNTTIDFGVDDQRQVQGTNFIAYHEGASNEHLVVVGAHYDSTGVTVNHYNERDNGVGIATLLEVARAFEDSIRLRGYTANYTTYFVAFDLNTKEQKPKSPGRPGSYFFVTEWLQPLLNRSGQSFQGSFILDSISTYNTAENSQNLPGDFGTIFPGAYKTITDDEKKGDFLAAVSDGNTSTILLDYFAGHYNHDQKLRPYRLQTLVRDLSATGSGTYETIDLFDDQASIHFWAHSLPSVLLTDTGNSRSPPEGEQTSVDQDYIFWNPERTEFVHNTYMALSYTVLDSQTIYVPPTTTTTSSTTPRPTTTPSSATAPSSTCASLVASVAFVVLARRLA